MVNTSCQLSCLVSRKRCGCQPQAAELPANSLARLLKVAAFAVSIYSCVYRPFAPFRSPTGETCELVAPDRGIRALGEKVWPRAKPGNAAPA